MGKMKAKEKKIVLPLKTKRTSKLIGSKYFLLSFLIPLFIIGISYAVQGVFPFGDKHILTIDLYHQYAPFLRELRSKIISGDSLFYSWTGGMGFNFFSVFTYYLASPFNLLLVLFKQKHLSDAIFLITILKIATSGLTFYLYTYFSNKKHSWFYLAIASSYALSAYSLAYSWNIMWLDTIILLPLCILGLTYLVTNQGVFLYVISLAFIIITNYYTAFFVCVFIAFYYFVLCVKESKRSSFAQKKAKSSFVNFLKFASSSLLAVGISAITLYPTLKALTRTSAVGDVFPASFDFFEAFIDFISRLLTLAPLSIRDGMPNLYAGVILLFLIPLFFINKSRSKGEKISHALLLVFLLLSLNNNVLNFIWHGFHYPNQLPYRNSFVLIFLLLSMAITVYNDWDSSLNLSWGKLFAFWMLGLLLLQKIDSQTYSIDIILVSLFLLAIYGLVFNLGQDPSMPKKYISFLLLSVIVVELLINTTMSIDSINKNEYYGTREGYMTGDMPDSIVEYVAEIKEDSPNARAALWPDKCVNDPMLYGYPGITIFASTYPEKPVQFFKNLGYDNNAINSYQNIGSNIILDSIFGLKYKITDQNRQEQVSFYNPISSDDITVLYENNYALPILYYLPSQIGNLFLSDEVSSFDNQRSLIQAMGGDPNILQNLHYQVANTVACSIEESSKNTYQITKNTETEGQKSLTFEFTAENHGAHTVAWEANGIKFDQVYLNRLSNKQTTPNEDQASPITSHDNNQKNLSSKKTSIADIGIFQAGEKASITFLLNDDSSDSGSLTFETNYINENLFRNWNDQLQKYTADPVKKKANLLSANIVAPNHGYILFSTSYDKGWQITVNSEKIEPSSLDGALILIPVQKGDNSIQMKFVPEGFVIGFLISTISVLISLLVFFFSKMRKYKKKRPCNKTKITHPKESDTNAKIRRVNINQLNLASKDFKNKKE